jgi:hypothetical protein
MARKRQYINFTPRQYQLLEIVSRALGVTIGGAVEYALESQLLHFAGIATFFGRQIEASPDSLLTREDISAAYREWCRLHGLTRKITADKFDTLALLVCRIKQIAVRVRDNQVVCVDVRLRQSRGGKQAD